MRYFIYKLNNEKIKLNYIGYSVENPMYIFEEDHEMDCEILFNHVTDDEELIKQIVRLFRVKYYKIITPF